MTFCHLNLHTDRSIMRGMIKPAALVDWCKRNGVKAAAVTDYGNMSAVIELYKACKDTDVMPIYGMEINLVEDKSEKDKKSTRMILLAKNRAGFKNLLTIATIGSMYFYYIPRVDIDVLAQHGDNLIALTGDIDGIAAQAFFRSREDGLMEVYDELSAIFGDDVYFEIEPVPSEPQRILNEAIVDMFKQTSGIMQIVATGDPHYLNESDRHLHENVMAIKQVRNPGWIYPMKGPYHVRTREEMIAQFSELHERDITNELGFKDALDAPDEIISKIERFDLREGVKIPDFVS